jgi:hypothetical protein
MSCTEIIKFDKKGESSLAGKVKNGIRGSFAVWNYLSHKYLGRQFSIFGKPSEQEEVWSLFEDDRLSEDEKIILGTTFDYVLIKKEDIPRVIEAFSALDEKEVGRVVKEWRENPIEISLPEQIEILKNLLADEDCIAIGWHQTNVSCDMWYDYNCVTGNEHWYLFDELKNES